MFATRRSLTTAAVAVALFPAAAAVAPSPAEAMIVQCKYTVGVDEWSTTDDSGQWHTWHTLVLLRMCSRAEGYVEVGSVRID
ncbi:MAG: hypothetical protein REI11_20095 [Patulibacter sp.]|nr:hypothetical protein [Patulibacter sp.]